MSKTFKLRLTKGSELTHVELDNNQSILLESASLTYSSASISGNTLKLFSISSTGSITPITHSYEIVSSSYAVTASYAISSSVEVTKEVSSSNADTASYFAEGIVNASAANNIITFTKDDSSTFDITIDTGSLKAGLLSSSAQIAEDISGSLSNVAISALNAGIVSASAQVRDRLVVASTFSSASNKAIRDTLDLNQFILSGSKPDADTLRLHPAGGTALDYVVGGGTDDRVDGLLLESGSVKSRLNTIEGITGSLIKNAALSGSTTNTIRFTKQDDSTIDVTIDTGSAGSTDYISNVSIASTGGGRTYTFNFTGEGNAHNATETLSLNSGIISSSTISSLTQGTVRQTLNGGGALPAEIDIVDLTKDGSPIFGGITISGSTIFGSGSTSFTHEFTGSTSIDGTLQLGGGNAIGNDITGAFWQGYQISSSKIDFNFEYGYPSLNNEINKKFEKATFDNTAVELTIHNNTGSTVLSTIDNRITGLLSETGSYALKTEVSGSGDVRFEALNAITGSLIKNAALSGSTTNTIRFTKQDDTTIDLTIATSSISIDGLLSSSAQIAEDISGSLSNAAIAALGGGHVSASALSSPSQGTIRLATNGVNTDVDSGLQAADSPTFAGLTVNGDITANKITTNIVTSSIAFTSGSNKFGDENTDKHMFTGSVAISGGLDMHGYQITNAYWEGYVISASKVDIDVSGFVYTTGSPVDNDFAKFTDANTIEGRSYSEVRSDLSLSTTDDVTFASGSFKGLTFSGNIDINDYYGGWQGQVISSSKVIHRTVSVDTSGNGTANETLLQTETLMLKKGSNITLSEADGVITIAAAGTAATNLSKTVSGDGFSINSSTGDDVALSLADTDNWGLMSDEMFDKLDGIETSADVTDATNVKANLPGGVPSGSAAQARTQIGAGTGDGTVTEVTVGTGLGVADGTTTPDITLDLSGLTDMTANVVGSQDELILLDNGAERRKLIQEITLSDFNNDSNWNNYSHPNHSGDVTSAGDGATTIANDAVTYAKMQNIPTSNILGRVTAGTGNVEDLTASQVRTLINVADGATNVTNNNQITNGAGYTTNTGTVDTSGTPANQQIAIFRDSNTISGSSHLRMHVNSGYPQFGGLIVGDGPDSNLYIGAAIEPTSADVGIRLHSTASGDFYFDFQGDATQTLYFRDYDGAGGSPTKFTFDFQNSDFETSTGTFSGNVTANNFITTSDRELKKDIEPIKEGLETLKQFVSYEYELDGKKDAGFIAQEVQESLPYAVHTKKDGYLALDTKPIIAHIHKAILEIDQRLSAIEEKLK